MNRKNYFDIFRNIINNQQRKTCHSQQCLSFEHMHIFPFFDVYSPQNKVMVDPEIPPSWWYLAFICEETRIWALHGPLLIDKLKTWNSWRSLSVNHCTALHHMQDKRNNAMYENLLCSRRHWSLQIAKSNLLEFKVLCKLIMKRNCVTARMKDQGVLSEGEICIFNFSNFLKWSPKIQIYNMLFKLYIYIYILLFLATVCTEIFWWPENFRFQLANLSYHIFSNGFGIYSQI